jgi:hypothetical protein
MLRSSAAPIGGQPAVYKPTAAVSLFTEAGLPSNQAAQLLGIFSPTEAKSSTEQAIDEWKARYEQDYKALKEESELQIATVSLERSDLQRTVAELRCTSAHHDRLVQLWRGATLGLFALFCFSRLFAT